MSTRKVLQLHKALEVSEGAGVSVYRAIGIPKLRNLDPFLMLDQMGSDDPDEYLAGFPEHPHRGFNTLTYMLDGHMEHRDSMGNRGDLRAGGAQWMKAGSGVLHSEMPKQSDGLMRGFQLWVNLPAKQKMTTPEYLEIDATMIPVFDDGSAQVRILAGDFDTLTGPLGDAATDLRYLDTRLAGETAIVFQLPESHCAFIYVFEGSANLDGTSIPAQHLAVLGNGEQLSVHAEQSGARFLLIAGKPIGEPIVQHGPFVMNSEGEIKRAVSDYQSGKLVQAAPKVGQGLEAT